MSDNRLGYIFSTGAAGADSTPYQHLVTIDAPTEGVVIHSCQGRQGVYYLSEVFKYGRYSYHVHVLPTPGGTTDTAYERRSKQTYRWKSKKFTMPGRTTLSAAKVVMEEGCVRLRLHADGCCRYDAVVQNCAPFRLPDQLVGIEWEIELTGQATVFEVHVASTIEELISGRNSG